MMTLHSPNKPSPEALREIRAAAVEAELHPESLLRVPLIKRAFTNLDFRLIERGVDAYWTYQKLIPTVSGFNPMQGAYFYSSNSFFSRWLRQPFSSARELNENDLLATEVLFMAHDYLHAWAYQMVDKLHPEAEVFSRAITAENLEEYSFYHLLSEAVATVGLDYWFLSLTDPNEFCNIGSTRGPLTVSYRELHLPEYKMFCPNFQVQSPQFLSKITNFYCTGKFPGFYASDLRRSPRLLAWLRHELQYGVIQRKLTRSWLMFLAEEPLQVAETELSSPLTVTPELEQLTEEIGPALWQLVKNDEDLCGSWHKPTCRQSSHNRTPDFRFLNLNRCEPEQWRDLKFGRECKTFQPFLSQYLAAVPFASVPRERLKYVDLMKRECDPQLTQMLLGDLPRLPVGSDEPRDLFTAN
jgi:hypothetical protein